MKPTTQTAVKWGLYIGLANLVWLYMAYYLGLHTSGVMTFQFAMLVWLIITITGFVLCLRAVRRRNPALTYLEGVKAGAVAALVSVIISTMAQIGYVKVVHPEWSEVMVHQTQAHFSSQGMTEAQIQKMTTKAKNSFTLANYALYSGITAMVLGIALPLIVMVFHRSRSTNKV
ncbi:DUF4199 domain-containing protein [Brevifollis gellanilyticus]|uniref:DUF4199 domain-containing protein n=1 Tax=Brevifollis gellanilyticus TaxID=748831 RepID=A0A512MDY6_9BACT|nr:DUF4199 domain-containing protein [Brevifollis gellanilyticus]GEP44947.1 hypothetical protein BGE01nite_42380 [Brevifollis gellanilyticus]